MEHRLACLFAKVLNKNSQRTELENAKMIYGLEVLLDNLLKVICIIMLSLILGIFKESMLVFLGFGALRLRAGGFHFDRNIMCWFTSILITIGGGYLVYRNFISRNIAILFLLIALIIILLYAPSGTINNPIAPENRKQYRMESIGLVILYLILTCFFGESQIGAAFALGGICEAITILPVVNRKYMV
ncbi:MAG: accessory gene regulator B family protein [Lachnospiraceae bacterium]|nr:accessory gene regulator B family protein [Lachnospiraceae bacterium]